MTTTLTEEELINQAMAVLDAPESAPPSAPAPATPMVSPQTQPDPQLPSMPVVASPTLQGLAASRRPKVKTVCECCPNSVWFASPAEVKCYCRVMFLVTWSSKEPQTLTACDGVFLGQEE